MSTDIAWPEVPMKNYDSIKQVLLRQHEELSRRLNAIQDDIRHADGPLNADFAEQAVELENNEVVDALGEEAQHTLALIKQALHRMEQGEYGLCENCGESIPEARLRAIPYTRWCVSCAEKMNT